MSCEDCKSGDLGRFSLSSTSKIRALLAEVADNPWATSELKEQCQHHLHKQELPWKLVQQAYECRRQQQDQTAVQEPAAAICDGSQLLFTSPPARERSKELDERLAKIRHLLEQEEYAALVADVTVHERQAAAVQEDPFFPTTRLQLSFGLHVVATMGAFFALGYYGGRLIFKDEAWAAMIGALGLTAGLLLEATLLIIRSNMPAPLDQKYSHLLDKRWDNKGQQIEAAATKQSKIAESVKKQQ